MPWVASSSISSAAVCPESAAWRVATSGQMQMSPSIPGGVGLSAVPGLSSSMGKLMTSVGPGRSSHLTCSSSMGPAPMNRMLSSASEATCICVST